MNRKNKSLVAVYWNDIYVYRNDNIHGPSRAYTEGVLAKNTSRYVLLKNPETILFNPPRNHPKKNPKFYYIPKSLITEINIVKKLDGKN